MVNDPTPIRITVEDVIDSPTEYGTIYDDSRPRGILTEADRKYVRDPDEYRRENTKVAASRRKRQIRSRVRNAAIDLHLLAEHLSDEILFDVFGISEVEKETDEGTETAPDIPAARIGLYSGIEFLIRGTLTGRDPEFRPLFSVAPGLQPFIDEIEKGVLSYLNHHHGLTAEIDVQVESRSVREVDSYADNLSDDDDLSEVEQIRAAAQLGRAGYTPEEVADVLGQSTNEE